MSKLAHFIHLMKLVFAKDRPLRRLMRLHLSERMMAAIIDRMKKLYERLKFKRKRAFKECAKSNKWIRDIFKVSGYEIK